MKRTCFYLFFIVIGDIFFPSQSSVYKSYNEYNMLRFCHRHNWHKLQRIGFLLVFSVSRNTIACQSRHFDFIKERKRKVLCYAHGYKKTHKLWQKVGIYWNLLKVAPYRCVYATCIKFDAVSVFIVYKWLRLDWLCLFDQQNNLIIWVREMRRENTLFLLDWSNKCIGMEYQYTYTHIRTPIQTWGKRTGKRETESQRKKNSFLCRHVEHCVCTNHFFFVFSFVMDHRAQKSSF